MKFRRIIQSIKTTGAPCALRLVRPVVIALFLVVIFSTVIIPGVVQVPHTFQSGQVISAQQINENFQALQQHIARIERSYCPMPVGTILAYGGKHDTVPEGWLLCDGKDYYRDEYQELFVVIGTLWGDGDGVRTFNVPDLRGIFLRGVDHHSGRDPDVKKRTDIRGGLAGDRPGSYQEDEIRSHSHYVYIPRDEYGYDDHYATTETDYSDEGFFPHSTTSTGGSETRPKNASVFYIIKH